MDRNRRGGLFPYPFVAELSYRLMSNVWETEPHENDPPLLLVYSVIIMTFLIQFVAIVNFSPLKARASWAGPAVLISLLTSSLLTGLASWNRKQRAWL